MTIFLSFVAVILVLAIIGPLRSLWRIQSNPLLEYCCPPATRAALNGAVRRRLLYLAITIGLLIYFW